MSTSRTQQKRVGTQTDVPTHRTDLNEDYPSDQLQSLSVIIPTYNEAENIITVIDRVSRALDNIEHEVLVVDDDSPDNTWKIVELAYENNPRVNVYRRKSDKGLAKAVKHGFEQSNHTCCAVIDADLQHPPEKLPELLFHMNEDTKIVIGSRRTDFGRIEQWSLTRKIVSVGATAIAKLALPITREINDPLSGFFIIRRDFVEDMFLQPNGYKILLELLVRGNIQEAIEVPFTFDERAHGESNLTTNEYWSFLKHVHDLRREA